MTHENPRALIRYALLSLVVTVALAWTLYLVLDALLLIYVSALVAVGLSPVVEALERSRWPARFRLPRWAAVLVIYVCFVGALVGLGMVVIPPLVTQARELWDELPALLRDGQQFLVDWGLIDRNVSVREAVMKSPAGGTDAVGRVLVAITSFLGGLFGIVTILILAFYFLVSADRMVQAFERMFPPAERPRVEDASRRVTNKVSAWLGGQLLLATIIGSTAALGLWLLGVPYFYVLALIAGIGEMVPVIGPPLAAIPAVLVAFSVSPTVALAVGVFFLVQQQLENHVLVPKVMERQVGVSAVVVILALLIGGSLLGIVGAILAVPTAAILQVLYEELFPDAVDG